MAADTAPLRSPRPCSRLPSLPPLPALRRWGSGWAARRAGRHWPQGLRRAAEVVRWLSARRRRGIAWRGSPRQWPLSGRFRGGRERRELAANRPWTRGRDAAHSGPQGARVVCLVENGHSVGPRRQRPPSASYRGVVSAATCRALVAQSAMADKDRWSPLFESGQFGPVHISYDLYGELAVFGEILDCNHVFMERSDGIGCGLCCTVVHHLE
jgi:hypothetical protein